MSNDEYTLSQITVYLKRLSAGDAAAESPLANAVYSHMQHVARGIVRNASSPNLTIQPTALVNEVLIELLRARSVDWQDRNHFFRVAARLLRRRFVDYIRMRRAAKRPQHRAKLDIDGLILPAEDRFEEIILVDEGLRQLTTFDASLAELVEMVYFGGIPISSIAEARGVSEKTVDRHLELARRWLRARFRVSCPSFSANNATSSGR